MSSEFDVAVVGATGAVGEAMISILEERNFPVRNLYPLASSRSAGKTVMFHGKPVTVTDLAEFDFSQAQIGLFSAGGSISAEYAPKAAAAGCVVIDNAQWNIWEYQAGLLRSSCVNNDDASKGRWP